MQWLVHTVRTFFTKHPVAAISVVTVPVLLVVGIAFFVATRGSDDREDIAAPDPLAVSYTEDVLVALDATPEEFVGGMTTALLPAGSEPEVVERLERGLPDAVGAASSSPADVADAVIRRAGPEVAEAPDVEALVSVVVTEIDPSGEAGASGDVDEVLDAMREWASQSTPHVLHITTGAPPSGAIDLRTTTFAEAAAALDALGSTSEVLGLVPHGLAGIDGVNVSGLGWTIDDTAQRITFDGSTSDLGGRGEAFAIAQWDGTDRASWTAVVQAPGWSLADAGIDGPLGETELPDAVLVVAERAVTVEPFAAPVEVAGGITMIASIDPAGLPSEIAGLVDAAGLDRLGLQVGFGADFGAGDGATVAIEAPGVEPPALPSWLHTTDDRPWSITLTSENGATALGLSGGLDAEVDGERRAFAARFDLDGDDAVGRLEATMVDPWTAPFGLDWLALESATMTVDLDGDASVATFDAAASVAARAASVTFEMVGGEAGDVGLEVAIDSLSAGDAIDFLAATTGVTAPADTPELRLDDVLIEVRVAEETTLAIGGSAVVAGQTAEVLAASETVGGDATMLFGVALDAWSLSDLLPEVSGTVLEELEFPASALVSSSLDTELDRNVLSAPTRRFLDGADVDGPLRLAPGVSLLTSLDVSGTALADPLAALGYSDGRFPVVGTLPGTAIGAGGGTSGSGLSLAVRLPEIAPAGAPDWFRGGQLSIVATGAPSLGLEGTLDVRIDGEDLSFDVGAEFARSGPGVELALFGSLATERPWESPFGIEWLTVNDAALQLTIDPIGTVGLGFGGSVVIGDRPIEVAFATELTGGVPTNVAMQGASPAGLSFSDVVAIQGSMASAVGAPSAELGAYPDLAVRDIELRFAREPFERLGIEAGFAVIGDVYVGSGDGAGVRLAELDVLIDDQGVVAAGSLTGYQLGPIAWSDIVLDLALTSSEQRFSFDGEASIFGLSARAEIELEADSIFFDGRQFLDDLGRAVDLFEQLLEDPAGTIGQLPDLFRSAGVPVPEWVDAIVDGIQPLLDRDVAVSEQAIDVVLNGGSIPLPVSPSNGEEPSCHGIPIEVDGRCYGTPPIPATSGTPSGGEEKECSRLAPKESGGRCYTSLPKGEVCLGSWKVGTKTYGMQLRNGRCYAKVKRVTSSGYAYYPSGGLAPTIDRGIPVGGSEPVCRVENPIEEDDRCYTIPPTPEIPGFPEGGAAPHCRTFWTLEDGRCWRITPSQAAEGLGAPGLCSRFGIECSIEDLISGRVARTLFDGVMERLD